MRAVLSVAEYAITASGALDADYKTISYASGTLTVTPAPLTVTALNQSRAYGGADSFQDGISGFVNGDFLDASKLSGFPTYTSTDTGQSSPVGNYAIAVSPGTLGYPNYTFDLAHCVPGMLTITPAPLTITASNQNQAYGFGGTRPRCATPPPSPFPPDSSSTAIIGASVTLSTNATLSSSSNYNAGTWTLTPTPPSSRPDRAATTPSPMPTPPPVLPSPRRHWASPARRPADQGL